MNDIYKWLPLFPAEEIPKILRIVHRCAGRLRKREPLEMENRLSERLWVYVTQDVEYRDELDAYLEPPEGTLFAIEGGEPTQLGRIDLRFLHGTGKRKPYPYFAIEAKRLHVGFPSGWKSLVDEYVTGHQGMMCFITGRYACGLRAGCMLGYVFDAGTDKARGAIGRAIQKHAVKLKTNSSAGLSRTNGVAEPVHESQHDLAQGKFTIYHIFADV